MRFLMYIFRAGFVSDLFSQAIDNPDKNLYNIFCCKSVCLAQLDRAFGYGPKGRGFESSNTRDFKKAGMFVTFPLFYVLL